MVLWSPDQGLKYLFPAVFWPWFGSVEFIFDLPTGQIATFSTGCLFCIVIEEPNEGDLLGQGHHNLR
jgi:hypothetical protein